MTEQFFRRDNIVTKSGKKRLNYITMLPSLITILNGMFGFASIVFASRGVYAAASYMLFFAMIADVLDGRVARMSHSTSSFGGQLDSLCDAISFGLAPAFLMLHIFTSKLGLVDLAPVLEKLLSRFVWFSAAVYLSCAIIRLARFNVENEKDESSHMSFIGLPTPSAAGVIASIILVNQEIIPDLIGRSSFFGIVSDVMVYSLPLVTLSVGILMVSRIRYVHLFNQYVKGKKPFTHLIRALLVLGLLYWNRQVAVMVVFCGFAANGFFRWLFFRLLRFRKGSDSSAK